MNLMQRAKAPTPKFFRLVRTVGLVLAGTGGAILTAPVALPAVLLTIGGYLTVAGGVITAVSQVTVHREEDSKSNEDVSP